MDIVFKGRHTDVLERFRKHAIGKLAKVEKLDHKAIRVDVEVTTEHNPRQSGRKERVELTITTRGPAIRAEAAAEDRFAALDLALAKLESRLRRACDRRKAKHPVSSAGRPGDRPGAADAALQMTGADLAEPSGAISASVPRSRPAPEARRTPGAGEPSPARTGGSSPVGNSRGTGFGSGNPAAAGNGAVTGEPGTTLDNFVAVEMQGEGPLVVREKFHVSSPMTIDQALFEMELVGHDFFLFTDTDGLASVVYRRRGYQYGVIRLVEETAAAPAATGPGLASERSQQAANLANG